MSKRILIVEDDHALARVLADNLTFAGFEVEHLDEGSEVVSRVRSSSPDLVLLDVALPGKDGFSLLGLIRQGGRTPVIMLTARDQKTDKLKGLELGADDYVTKPFDFEELQARIRAVLRRALANGRYASPAAIADYGRMMLVESQQLTRLIDNVLCYARINDTMSGYDMESVDVGELVQESVDRFRPQLAALGFELQLQLPAEPPLVRADHAMLVQAFENVIDNAAKYAASGRWLGVTVTPSGRQVRIEIADRGEGIPADELTRVFEKFYRRKGSRHRGSGLGLAIVRRIVEDHGGRASIASAVGQGSTVTIEVPTDS